MKYSVLCKLTHVQQKKMLFKSKYEQKSALPDSAFGGCVCDSTHISKKLDIQYNHMGRKSITSRLHHLFCVLSH